MQPDSDRRSGCGLSHPIALGCTSIRQHKVGIHLICLFLFLIPQIAFAGGSERSNCKNNEILASLVDYSYCIPKEKLESLRVLGGKHTTLYVIERDIEYSFAKMPTSVAILDIHKKNKISLSTFFERLINVSYTENGYSDIRSAFDIKKQSIASNYTDKKINAYYIINDLPMNSSIYLLNDSEEYLYIIKGNFSELFAKKFLSELKYIF